MKYFVVVVRYEFKSLFSCNYIDLDSALQFIHFLFLGNPNLDIELFHTELKDETK